MTIKKLLTYPAKAARIKSIRKNLYIYLKVGINMAKGQKRSNKEVKKQKQSKTITVLAPNTVGLPKPRKLSDTYILPKKLTS